MQYKLKINGVMGVVVTTEPADANLRASREAIRAAVDKLPAGHYEKGDMYFPEGCGRYFGRKPRFTAAAGRTLSRLWRGYPFRDAIAEARKPPYEISVYDSCSYDPDGKSEGLKFYFDPASHARVERRLDRLFSGKEDEKKAVARLLAAYPEINAITTAWAAKLQQAC